MNKLEKVMKREQSKMQEAHKKLSKKEKINKKQIVQIHFNEDGSLCIIPTSEKAMSKFVNLMLSNAFEMMQTMVKKGKKLKNKKRTKKVHKR